MFGKRKTKIANLLELSEADLQDANIQQLIDLMKQCCCNVCGGEVVLKKMNTINDTKKEVVPHCKKCGHIKCAIDQQLYLNRLNLLINDTMRYM